MARKRPADEDAADPFERDDSDEETVKKKKKKKKKKVPENQPPPKIGSMVPKTWTPQMLVPFKRVLWEGGADDATAADDTEAQRLRQRLGLRVPEVRRKTCRFWRQGLCKRGDACSFAHGETASGPEPPMCPPPVESLSDPGLPRCIGRAMLHLGLREPSPIQAQAWPAALHGHDLLCRAPTGSGKTLGYLLPAVVHALAAPAPKSGTGPSVVILLPTRELCMQVLGVCRSLRRPCGIHVEALYGGEPREDQVCAAFA